MLTNRQRTNRQASVSKTESTLILSGSSPDTRGSWPIISHQKCRHPTPSPPSPSTVRSRDHTVLYCTIVLYSTKKEKICLQHGTKNSNTETTLSLSSVDTRGSWPIISHQKCRHPTHSPPSPSTVRSRDHTVLYCTIVLYSTKKE